MGQRSRVMREVDGALTVLKKESRRKRKITDDELRDLLIVLETGGSYKMACEASGFPYQRLMGYFSDYDKIEEESEFYDLVKLIRKSRAKFYFKALRAVKMAVLNGDVKAAQWQLTNLTPEEVGPRKAIELSGPAGGPIETHNVVEDARAILREELSNLTDEQLEDIVDIQSEE